MDLVIENGIVLTPDSRLEVDVGVRGARIAAIAEGLAGAEKIDATGCYVLPGGVDPHVHLQMPAGDYVSSDDFATGTVAAALGGTTTIIDFVEPEPEEGLIEALRKRQAEADSQVAVDYGLHMTIPAWHAAHPEFLKELPDVVEAGVSSFKLYMAYEDLRLDDAQLYEVMGALREVGGLPMIHCENGPICEVLRSRALARGDRSPIHHAATRPPLQEAEAVSRAIDIASLARSPVYIAHVSCQAALARINAAQARGETIYGETCPQYLLLDRAALGDPGGERLICAPPLRTEKDRAALWSGLVDGHLHVLATDHCAFTTAEKEEHPDFTTVPGGLPSIEGRIALAHHLAAHRGMSLEAWVRICCATPASIFGLRRKGKVAVGFDADLVVFDPRQEVTIEAGQTLHENVDWTPYSSMRVRGWVRDVIGRGEAIVREGTFVGQAGGGRFVPRTLSMDGARSTR